MKSWILKIALAFSMVMSTLPMAQIAPPAPPAMPVLPLVDPANELTGAKLVDALRGGGYVLYMRHALQIPPTTEKCDGSNLTPVGEAQARTVGAALRELKIPIGSLRSSKPCRNRDTARLLGLGSFELTDDLNPAGLREGFDVSAARARQLQEAPPRGTNTLLVSHVHGSVKKEEWMHLEIAEIIIYRPDGKGGTAPVARVRVEGWEKFIELMRRQV